MVQVTSYNIVLVAAIGSITYGFSSAIISTTLGQPSFLEYFELETRTNSISLVTCIVALSQLGGLIGVLSISVLADRLGRKGLLYIARALAIIFFALQAGSVNIAMFITFRTLGGIPVGMFLSGVPLYQSEIAPPQIRGRLMALHGVLFLLLGLGLPASKQIILSAGYITCSPFGNIISMYLIDSLGRRKMLLTGVTGCLVLLAGEMIVIARGLETEGGKILFWFSIFQDGVTFTYSAEIWPNHLRAKGFSVSMSGFFIGSLLFLDTIFIGSSTIIGVAIYFYWPETKGIPLESVAAVFGDAVAEETALGRENDKGAVKWGA
ncbi:hypothetical protein RQP46_007806 [Phenoliferia psychrophenolica]